MILFYKYVTLFASVYQYIVVTRWFTIQITYCVLDKLSFISLQDIAAFKISALQRALQDSVPALDLEKVNKQYHNLTEKYRDMLERGNNLVSKAEHLECLRVSDKS